MPRKNVIVESNASPHPIEKGIVRHVDKDESNLFSRKFPVSNEIKSKTIKKNNSEKRCAKLGSGNLKKYEEIMIAIQQNVRV